MKNVCSATFNLLWLIRTLLQKFKSEMVFRDNLRGERYAACMHLEIDEALYHMKNADGPMGESVGEEGQRGGLLGKTLRAWTICVEAL